MALDNYKDILANTLHIKEDVLDHYEPIEGNISIVSIPSEEIVPRNELSGFVSKLKE